MCDKIPVWMVSESNPIPVGCLGCKGVSLEFRRLNVRVLACTYVFSVLAPVVQKLYSAIHAINRYPEDKYYENQLHYPLDSNIYPVDSAIRLSKNWGQVSNVLYFYCGYILKHVCGYMVTKSP